MKTIIRALVFVIVALNFSQYIVNSFSYGHDETKTYLLIVLALSILYFLLRPILKIVSLPSEGLGYTFLLFALTFAVLYVLTLFIQSFTIKPTTLSGLNIFGFVLPSKDLTSLWAAVFSALVISVTYNFLQGLCSRR